MFPSFFSFRCGVNLTFFNGFLCLSGEELGCRAVKDAQDAEGRWWRSPRRTADNLGQKNSFSRDQTMGVLLATKDTTAASSWLGWIDATPHSSQCCGGRNL